MRKIMAQTFTPFYDAEEDRVILIINYEDFSNRVDFMITRRFILNLLPTADEFMLQHYSDEKTNQNLTDKKTDTVPNSVQNSDYLSKTNSENLELFSKEKELLQTVNFIYIADKALTTLTLSSKNSSVITSVEASVMKQIIKSIKTAIPHFSWGISPNF